MISPLMVSSKNVKVSQKRCLGTSIESFTGSSLSEQIMIHGKTRGPLGHLLDTAIRCFRAVRVGITIAEKMAVEKLQFH